MQEKGMMEVSYTNPQQVFSSRDQRLQLIPCLVISREPRVAVRGGGGQSQLQASGRRRQKSVTSDCPLGRPPAKLFTLELNQHPPKPFVAICDFSHCGSGIEQWLSVALKLTFFQSLGLPLSIILV